LDIAALVRNTGLCYCHPGWNRRRCWALTHLSGPRQKRISFWSVK